LTVQIVDDTFQPANLQIQAGQTVTWVNADDDEHTASGAAFDTGTIPGGGSGTATFATPGTYSYICNYHPDMQGTILVADAAGSVPAGSGASGSGEGTSGGASGGGTAAPAAGPGETAVAIVDFAFEPATVSVAAGSTVVWTNVGSAPHTVTGDFVDSGTMEGGQTFSFTFDQEGSFAYICAFHPQMTGTVQVGPVGSAAAGGQSDSGTSGETAEGGGDPAGAWQVSFETDADGELVPRQALLTLHADGTLASALAIDGLLPAQPGVTVGPGHGAWESDDDGAFTLTSVALLLDPTGGFAGTLTFQGTGQLDGDDTYLGACGIEALSPDGAVVARGGGETQGTRIAVDS
jgi:plastocyanin